MLMKTDELGIPRFSNKDLIDMIYSGHVDKCHVVLCDESDDIDLFNKAATEQGISQLTKYIPLDVNKDEFDGVLQSEWFMPDEYKNMDIFSWLEQRCPDHESVTRVEMEIIEYEARGMLDLLCYMVYLVDFMRENNIVWGVGRGSSVASYILYLIGVHKVNSIQYGLDFNEFMR
jgi:DNA polymerase III alpha subunit